LITDFNKAVSRLKHLLILEKHVMKNNTIKIPNQY